MFNQQSNNNNNAIEQLVYSLSRLPSLGTRSARRIALHLLRRREATLLPLISNLQNVADNIKICQICRNFDVNDPCNICTNHNRDKSIICVVEDVADLWAMERSGLYKGVYHVLGGVLSAIDGITPEHLGIDKLLKRINDCHIRELILATNATVDGQTTAHYINDTLQLLNKTDLKITKLAQGIPIGGELDYLDDGTLAAAMKARYAV
jgi:recombination protein RecR